VDLVPEHVEAARRSFPEICFRTGNAEELDLPDACMDLVLLFMVFGSILDDQMAAQIAGEARRVLKPGGAVVWYDWRYPNPGNPHVRAIPRAMIRRLFPGFGLCLRSVTLLPPLARRLGRATPVLYPVLTKVPPLRAAYCGLLCKPCLEDRR
jgi:ubiquinone/menaquinone biosynthesis C-methylase UbiE